MPTATINSDQRDGLYELVRNHLESREADAETNARLQLGLDTCEEVLVGLDEREGERA